MLFSSVRSVPSVPNFYSFFSFSLLLYRHANDICTASYVPFSFLRFFTAPSTSSIVLLSFIGNLTIRGAIEPVADLDFKDLFTGIAQFKLDYTKNGTYLLTYRLAVQCTVQWVFLRLLVRPPISTTLSRCCQLKTNAHTFWGPTLFCDNQALFMNDY